MSVRCLEVWCRSDDIITNPVSRTPGFQPTYECRKCGFRWIDRFQAVCTGQVTPRLRELHDAMKAFHARADNASTIGSRAGRRSR